MPPLWIRPIATRRPVKLVMSYTEELMAANARHAARIDIKTGVRKDGTEFPAEASISAWSVPPCRPGSSSRCASRLPS